MSAAVIKGPLAFDRGISEVHDVFSRADMAVIFVQGGQLRATESNAGSVAKLQRLEQAGEVALLCRLHVKTDPNKIAAQVARAAADVLLRPVLDVLARMEAEEIDAETGTAETRRLIAMARTQAASVPRTAVCVEWRLERLPLPAGVAS